jgi:conjugative relaxase-like TrwC/TraI family protein
LNVVALRDGKYLISSVALGIDEYYLGVGEAPGTWDGIWSKELGLVGVVEAEELSRLIDGHQPRSGDDLVAGLRERKVKAFDCTFSAPKSVSLLWALGTEGTARAVKHAHDEAVGVGLGFLEEHAAVARQQVGGVRTRVATRGWSVARFVHRTSREGDPQLHTHCLVPNLVERAGDGRHVALDSNLVYAWARAAGSLYQNHLQRLLAAELGVAWGPDRRNTREIAGFTRSQLRAFSKRSAQVEAELEARGADYEAPGLRMRADEAASLATRASKDHTMTPANLIGRWVAEAGEVGLPLGANLDASVLHAGRHAEAVDWTWDEVVACLVDEDAGLCAHAPRFTEADVIEHLCALSGGAWSTEQVLSMASRFLASEHAVRLVPSTELGQPGRRRPSQWSTAVHRALEDDTLAVLRRLVDQPDRGASDHVVDAILVGATGLGDDQAEAVRVVCGLGSSVRAALSPAGFGKTALVHAAASALTADGRPVLGVATTAKAVAELQSGGLPAVTIARLRIDLTEHPMEPGTVVVLDELSQTSTRDAHTVLHAIAACPDGVLIVLGDPRQSPSVKAGGIAAEVAELAKAGRILSAELEVNRRQVDPADQAALAALRAGRPAESQAVRAEHGWEHEHDSPTEAREALATAAVADMTTWGTHHVAVLAVSHTDAEDLADRIRHRLLCAAVIDGPGLTGPGWATDRTYQPGDRVLLHTRCGRREERLVNGTTGTVIAAEPGGLDVALDDGRRARLPVEFVQGHKRDASPNLSHAWVRTIDGAQGGTWEVCHLLGTGSLDAFRGYTGQSRSRQPTHTWNTIPAVTLDYGGVLADQRTPSERVAAALARDPDPTMAVRSDPWVRDRELRARIAEHEAVLATEPPDRRAALTEADRRVGDAERETGVARARLREVEERLSALGPLGGVTRRGRRERDQFQRDRDRAETGIGRADVEASRARQQRAAIAAEQLAHEQFVTANRWRHGDVRSLQAQLDRHWASAIVDCTRAGDPLAFGTERLQHARHTVAGELRALVAQVPRDQRADLDRARAESREAITYLMQAREHLAVAETALAGAKQRRLGPLGRRTVEAAGQRVESALAEAQRDEASAGRADAEVQRLREHQDHRAEILRASAPRQAELERSLTDLDVALERTRVARVVDLLGSPDAEVIQLLGQPPRTRAAAAVWCHHALGVETVRDREPPTHDRAWKLTELVADAGAEIASATLLDGGTSEVGLDPRAWAACAEQARAVAHGRRLNADAAQHIAHRGPEIDVGL